jgi:hypothetical protein
MTLKSVAANAAAIEMLGGLPKMAHRRTIAGDRAYDTKASSLVPGRSGSPPNTTHSANDAGTTRHPGHAISHRNRQRLEETSGGPRPSAADDISATESLAQLPFS